MGRVRTVKRLSVVTLYVLLYTIVAVTVLWCISSDGTANTTTSTLNSTSYSNYHRNGSSHKSSNISKSTAKKLTTPLIVMKLPRSGSTWFTELLNSMPEVFVSKEIIQRSDSSRYSTALKQQHLQRALLYPSDKLSSTFCSSRSSLWLWQLPSGRFVEDYYYSGKLFRAMKVIGFTINPEHCQGVDWGGLVKDNRLARLLVFTRENIVKSAVSGYQGSLLKQSCGSSNVKRAKNCTISSTINWDAQEFIHEVAKWQVRYHQFEARIKRSFSSTPSLQRISISYEELLSNTDRTLERVRSFLALESRYPNVVASDSNDKYKNRKSQWMKRTPDSLQLVLSNYHRIVDVLNRSSDCSCWQKQLQHTGSTGSSIFYESCINSRIHRCVEAVERMDNL